MLGFVFLNAGGVTLSLSTTHAKLATPVAGGTGDQWAANFRDPDGHLLSVFGPEKA